MLTIKEMLNIENINEALLSIQSKKDSCGMDGMRLSELEEFIKINPNWFWNYFNKNNKKIGVVKSIEIRSYNNKKRRIFIFNAIDRLIGRMLSNVLNPHCEKILSDKCHSYRENMGITSAILQIREYVESGDECLVSIDIKNYFENIDHDILREKINQIFENQDIIDLIWSFVQCDIFYEGEYYTNSKGLITGANISPILSNLYLSKLDLNLEQKDYKFVRFGDDYFILTDDIQKANEIKDEVEQLLNEDYKLTINKDKSGVFSIFNKKVLGHYFYKDSNKTITVKRIQKSKTIYNNWNTASLDKKQNKYYILNEGILSRKDWTILFENENNKRYIPVEVVENINVYSNIIFNINIFEYFHTKKITTSIFDRYGNLIGRFIPLSCIKAANLLINQVKLYIDNEKRIPLAKKMQISSLHNMRANLRYYKKKRDTTKLTEAISKISQYISNINQSKTINDMMLIEARARQEDYSCFNEIIKEEDFFFKLRSKRPPRDEINALISFGNVFLYNELATIVNKRGLDIRISVIHSANNRNASLNLDIADIFKPIVVDKVIFTLINRKEIRKKEHFESIEKGGVYLNREGKTIFIKALEEKLNQTLMIGNRRLTYTQILHEEVNKIAKHIQSGENYKPYKHQ